MPYYQKAIKIETETGINYGAFLNNIELYYIGLKDYERGMQALFSARKIIKKNNDNKLMGANARWIAESYLSMKEYAHAKIYADTATIYTKKQKML